MTSPATTSTGGGGGCVAIACGGTGGHLFPGVAIAEQLVQRDCAVTLLISPKQVDQQAVKDIAGVNIVTLPAVALQGRSCLPFLKGFWRSWRFARGLFKTHPQHAVLAMGGFTSAPPILAGRSLRSRTFIHESNAIPGRANRWLGRFVDQAFFGFPSAASRLYVREATVTGTPVRSGIQPIDASACRKAMGLDSLKPVVLVTGGSQGASGVNQMVLSALPLLAKRATHWQWIHLTGPNDFEEVKQAYVRLGVNAKVLPFLSPMHLALGAATASVSRAGASSLAEMAAMRLPSLLVPYPQAADNHQYHNANEFVKTGAAEMLEQKDATPEKVANILWDLVENLDVRAKMQYALAQWHTPKAAGQIAEIILTTIAAPVEIVVKRGGQKIVSAKDTNSNSPIALQAGRMGLALLLTGASLLCP